ncbi:hypothetical protein P5V15_003317 [Pogonomyrmex californicus]
MWIRSFKCPLVVVLLTCAFFAGSGARETDNEDTSAGSASIGAYAGASGASASALSSTSVLGETENTHGAHDGHKGIRSYDSTGFPHDINANRGVKSYGTPSGHGASDDHGIKSGHGYNKNSDDCSKCKWENDDYWERDEPEEEGDENNGDECDDGQYRPDKTHHHGSTKGHKPGSRPPGVHKIGPTGVYVDDGATGENRPGSPLYVHGSKTEGTTPSSWNRGTTPSFGSPSTPVWSGRHDTPAGSPAGFPSTSKPGVSWNFGGNFGTTPKPGGPSWSTGSSVPAGRFPSSQGPGATSKPGQGWNTKHDGVPTAGFPSSQKPAPSWNTGHGSTPTASFGVTPKPESNWPRYDNTGGFPSTSRPGVPWSTGGNFGTTPKPGQNWNTRPDDKPESNWNPDQGITPGTSSCTQTDSGCSQGKQVPVKPGATPIDISQTKSGQFPSGISPAIPHVGSSSSPVYSHPQNRPYGQPGTQSTFASAYAGAGVTTGIGSPYGGAPNFEKKDQPFGFDKPASTQTPYHPTDQAFSGSNTYTPGNIPNYNKHGHGIGSHGTWPTTITNTFGTTERSYGEIGSPGSIQGNVYTPGKLPGSPGGSGIYEHPSVTKPSSGGNIWQGTGTTGPYIGFPTTKTPLSHVSIPSSTLSTPYDRTGPKQPSFNIASSSATASAGANTSFGTSLGAHSTPSITGTTSIYGTTPAHNGDRSYTPGIKGSVGSKRPTYGTTPLSTYPNSGGNSWPGKQPEKGTTSDRYPVSGTWPGGQPGSSNVPWSSRKPEDGSGVTPSRHLPSASGTWPGKQPEGGSGTWPTRQPEGGSGRWPTRQPDSGTWPSKQPGDGSGTWPNQGQPGHGSGSACSNVYCGDAAGSYGGGSSCGGCCGNYNCGDCSGGSNNVPATHGLCGGTIGPSGVNKTYYPAGTGDGNVPNIGSYPGSGVESYPGINQGTTSEGPVQWNPANPFLYGGRLPSDVSRPWTETTDKPIGKGNPFLDPNWSSPKPEYSINNDKNIIPHGEGNTKPIGQGNPFLDGSKGSINPNEGVIPLERKKPEGSNPFLKRPFGDENRELSNPLYGGHPDGLGTSGDSLGSGISGSNPFLRPSGSGNSGLGGPSYGGHLDGSEISKNNPFLRPSGSGNIGSGSPSYDGYPDGAPGSSIEPGISGSNPFLRPESGTTGLSGPSYGGHPDGSRTPGSSSGSGIPGSPHGLGRPGSSLGSGTPGSPFGSGTPGSSLGSGISGSGSYAGVKGGFHPDRVSPQIGNNDGVYPKGSNPQVPAGPLQCKLGLFGCGTSGSGSYAGNKYPGGAFGGNVGTGIGSSGNVNNAPGGSGNPGVNPVSSHTVAGAGIPGAEGNLAASGGAHAGAYAGSFAQASSSSFAGAGGSTTNFGGIPNAVQNQGGSNSWASSGASAFASSSAGSWSGNHPINVKG